MMSFLTCLARDLLVDCRSGLTFGTILSLTLTRNLCFLAFTHSLNLPEVCLVCLPEDRMVEILLLLGEVDFLEAVLVQLNIL